MSHRRLLGAAALAAAASVITVVPSAGAATATAPAFTGSSYAAKLPGIATPAALEGFECKNLPQLPSLPGLPSLPQLPKGSVPDLPPVVGGGDLDLSGLGKATGLSTDTKLLKQDDASYGVTSTNSISDVSLDLGPAGTLDISGLDVTATATTASADANGVTAVGVGDITLTSPDGAVHKLPVPTPGDPTAIPGGGTVSLGGSTTENGAHAASAVAQGLVVKLADAGKLVLGGASAIANDGDIPGLAQAGELDPTTVIDLLCNTDPQTVFQQLAQLPPALLDAAGISVTKTDDGYTGSFGDMGSLTLGLSGLSADTSFGHLSISTTPDDHITVTGDATTAGTIDAGGTALDQIPALAKGITLPDIGSISGDASGGADGLKVDDLTLTGLGDRAQLLLVDGVDLALTPSS